MKMNTFTQRRPTMQMSQYFPNTNYPQNNVSFINKTEAIPPRIVDPATPPDPPKMRWGAPTWYLFHTLAHKINETVFLQISTDLLQNIAIICYNLPCPVCADHATKYIQSKPFFQIKTKQQLKDFLFTFHNQVSKEKNAPQYLYEDLDTKYNLAVTVNIIQNFIYFFQDRSHSVKLIADDLHRSRILNNLKEWFSKNIQYFDA